MAWRNIADAQRQCEPPSSGARNSRRSSQSREAFAGDRGTDKIQAICAAARAVDRGCAVHSPPGGRHERSGDLRRWRSVPSRSRYRFNCRRKRVARRRRTATRGGASAPRGAIRSCRASGPPRVNTVCRSSVPSQYGTRQFLTDAEHAKRLEDVRIRDARDLARVDVLSGKVDGPNAPIPHWREYNTTSRRTSLVIDPPDGRLPPRTAQARPVPVQRCGSLQRGEPCDSVRGLRPRRPLHRAWGRASRRDDSRRLQRQHADRAGSRCRGHLL